MNLKAGINTKFLIVQNILGEQNVKKQFTSDVLVKTKTIIEHICQLFV